MRQLLRFQVGEKRLAVPVERVVEVIPAVAISAVPSGPPILEGVIEHRGRIVPVLETRLRLGLPPRPLHVDDHMIVATVGSLRAALRVDRALDLVTVDDEAIEAAADTVPQAELVAGLVRLPDGVLVIQDLERFLDAEEAEAVRRAVQTNSRLTGAATAVSEAGGS
ncbi:MAG: chemotaxis protein CheW [Longimicrobiales bacterium]|nr:chemotaxis protein CheW [Longimicrobiales bacterium]